MISGYDDVDNEVVGQEPGGKEEKVFMTSKEFLTGLAVFAIGIAVGSIFYGLGYLTVYFFSFHYAVKAIAGLAIALLLLVALDKAMGEKPSRMKMAVLVTLIIIYIILNFIGYNKSLKPSEKEEAGKEVTSPNVRSVSETGNLNTVGGVWFTDKLFKSGAEVTIEVTYSDVKMVNGDVLAPGVYHKTLKGDGVIMFEGVSTKPAKVKVVY